MQRFPRLHAQLVEAVSELLRERLGPTSDYASSLISIQAAYINTNHPEFVAGSANIAREGPPAANKAPSSIASPDDEESSSEDENDPQTPMNSLPPYTDAKTRAASVSGGTAPRRKGQAEPVAPLARHMGDHRERNRPVSASGGPASMSGASPLLSMSQAGTNPGTAKETFLNYFFGSNGPPGSGPNGTMTNASGSHHQGGRDVVQRNAGSSARELLPDLGTRRGTANGRGNATLDAPSAAYDMKSLGRHLEAVSVYLLIFCQVLLG